MLRVGLLALSLTLCAACILPDLDLTGRPCPCTDGYVCDTSSNQCVQALGSGGSGATGGEGTGGTGGQGGSGDCTTGNLDCDGDPTNGCETNPDTDPAHCGACETPCTPDNVGMAVCSAGTCDYDACADLFADCDNDRDNGCERPANTLTDCGGCDLPCEPQNANGAACDTGTCDYLDCNGALVGDCDGDRSTGCELDLAGDNANCGACDAACNFSCNGGTCPKTVFVSSVMTSGNIGGIPAADALCQSLATNAGLEGTFYAWLSDSTSAPATHFTQSSTPYMLINGTLVANNWADLTDGNLVAAINLTELGGPIPVGDPGCFGGIMLWTNTTSAGTMSDPNLSCSNWASTTGSSAWGMGGDLTNWTSWCSGGICSWNEPIYCFQQ